jgi:putative transposase
MVADAPLGKPLTTSGSAAPSLPKPSGRGGARPGAGRKPNGERAGVSHLRRPTVDPRHPIHVLLRVQSGLPSLRSRAPLNAVRAALDGGREQSGFELLEFDVQRDQLHLIAKAEDQRSLARGLQGLSIRVARAYNSCVGRNGKLFSDRYEARALATPRELRALRHTFSNSEKA